MDNSIKCSTFENSVTFSERFIARQIRYEPRHYWSLCFPGRSNRWKGSKQQTKFQIHYSNLDPSFMLTPCCIHYTWIFQITLLRRLPGSRSFTRPMYTKWVSLTLSWLWENCMLSICKFCAYSYNSTNNHWMNGIKSLYSCYEIVLVLHEIGWSQNWINFFSCALSLSQLRVVSELIRFLTTKVLRCFLFFQLLSLKMSLHCLIFNKQAISRLNFEIIGIFWPKCVSNSSTDHQFWRFFWGGVYV